MVRVRVRLGYTMAICLVLATPSKPPTIGAKESNNCSRCRELEVQIELQSAHWALAEKAVKVLQVFEEATREASGDYSCYYPSS